MLLKEIKLKVIENLKSHTKNVFTIVTNDNSQPLNSSIKCGFGFLMIAYNIDHSTNYDVKRNMFLKLENTSFSLLAPSLLSIFETLNSEQEIFDDKDLSFNDENYLILKKFLFDISYLFLFNLYKIMQNIDEITDEELKKRVFEIFLEFRFIDTNSLIN